MAEETIVEVYKVTADTSQALKELQQLRATSAALREEQEKLDRSTKEGADEYAAYSARIKAVNADAAKLERQIVNNIKATEQAADSYNALSNELNNARAQLKSLSQAELQGAKGDELREKISRLDAQLKEMDASMGVFNRNVGDYEGAILRAGGSNTLFGKTFDWLSSALKTVQGGFAAAGKGVAAFSKQLVALLANPVVLVIAAIAAAVAGLVLVFNKMINVAKSNEEQFAKLQQVMAPIRAIADWITRQFEDLADVFLTVASGVMSLITAFTDWIGLTDNLSEATAEYVQTEKDKAQLLKDERKLNEDLAKSEVRTSELRAKLADKEGASIEERRAAMEELKSTEQRNAAERKRIAEENLRLLEIEASRTKNSTEAEEKLSAARIAVDKATSDYNAKMRELNAQTTELTREEKAQTKALQDKVIALAEFTTQIEQARLKAEAGYQSQDESSRVAYQQRLSDIEARGARQRLELQKQFGHITLEEYRNQSALLEATEQENVNTRRAELNRQYAELRDTLLEYARQTTEGQIEEENRRFAALQKNLEKARAGYTIPIRLEGETDEQYDKRLAEYEKQIFQLAQADEAIQREHQENLRTIQEEGLQKRMEEIERGYADDLATYSDNERKKLEIEEKMLREQIDARKKAGKNAGELEARLRANQLAQEQTTLDAQLARTDLTARERYEARKTYLDKEAELYKDNAERQAQIAADQAANEQELLQARIDAMREWADGIASTASNLNELLSTIGERQIQRAEDENERQKELLKNRLDSGLIAQEEYDSQVAKLDADLAKKQAKLEREAAIREKAMNTFSVIINTAAAIMETYKKLGWPLALPGIIQIGITSAAQLATIAAAPLPKASRGGLISGPTHAAGGVPIEAEGGETIINRRSSKAYLELLSLINQAGGGVPFVAPLSDGAYAVSHAYDRSGLTGAQLTQAVRNGLQDLKIYTTIEDIRRQDAIYTRMENRGNGF